MRVLITGAAGQLGTALQETAPASTDIIAATSAVLDIGDATAVKAFVKAAKPDLLINAAAYTAVDRAEEEADIAFRVNSDAVGHLASAAEAVRARFVHVSTDFVFDGVVGRPYAPCAPTSPLGIYGESKLRGEQKAGDSALIIRTAWVYSSRGNNFVRTMLRLMAERDKLSVVTDQIGTPTWTTSLADAVWQLADANAYGIYHYTDSGTASWYDFAVAVQEEALAIGLLTHMIPIIPIPTSAYPTAAQRPFFSVLDKSKTSALIGKSAPHWRVNLRRMLAEVKNLG